VILGDTHIERLRDDDDELLQFALQQSLLQSDGDGAQVNSYLPFV